MYTTRKINASPVLAPRSCPFPYGSGSHMLYMHSTTRATFSLYITPRPLGSDSFPRGVCLRLALEVQIPSLRRHYLQSLDSLLEDALFSRGSGSTEALEVLFPSSRRLLPLQVLIPIWRWLHLQEAVSLLQGAYDFKVPFCLRGTSRIL